MSAPWVVLKFGGTSVATASGWERVAARTAELRAEGRRVWVVASALSQVSNRLEEATRQAIEDRPLTSLDWIRTAHDRLAADLDLEEAAFAPVTALLDELERLLEGIRLTREASPRLRARVMSFGELASTHIGLAALAARGVAAQRVDARDLLLAGSPPDAPDEARYLDAAVAPRRDVLAAEAAADGCTAVLTQGFIARTDDGATCLLGRGGSDTSGALFAALLAAESLEIWTDVHGLFTTDPRRDPAARLIRRMSYREAQELAAMGARVLHPRMLLPCQWAGVPITIRNTHDPARVGTRITQEEGDEPAVMAVVQRGGVMLLTISTLEMWGAPGFLSRVFAPFEESGISVDLVATSQAAVSLTLDRIPGGTDGAPFHRLLRRLQDLGQVEVVGPTAVVSIVGRRIRTVLHELGPALSVFREHQVHLVSESSEDLNLSFVVDEADAQKLVSELHARLLPRQGADGLFGPSWELLTASSRDADARPGRGAWWRDRRDELTGLVADGAARYVYDLGTVTARAEALRTKLTSIDRIYYAMKANPHPAILRAVAAAGLGVECVSAAEIDHARAVLGAEVPLLFTPNFCALPEYDRAFEAGAEVTLDGPHLLTGDRFAGRSIAVRVDPGGGLGHHKKVVTAGAHAKFGHPAADLAAFAQAARDAGATITGLHSHVGSGILDPAAWSRTLEGLLRLREHLPDLLWIDLGGGLGVVERPGQRDLDLDELNAGLSELSEGLDLALRMEPGRYLVSEAGVLIAPVNQVREKGAVTFIGLATGMNSLLRPALYGAWHGIHNLTRLGEPTAGYAHVVGPICETGDILGRDRPLPTTAPGDVLLIENAGAYGRVMSSRYNLREPADEVILGE